MKKIKLLVFILLVFIIVIVYWVSSKTFYAEQKQYYKIEKTTDDNFPTIAVLGDSWASRVRIDSIFEEKLRADYQINSKVIVFSHPGGNSKDIYEDLFKEEKENYSAKYILKNSPQYVVIMIGVNDSFRGFGKDFYSHHMIRIIEMMLYYNVTPIIVELPKFGIKESQVYREKMGVYRDNIRGLIQNENFYDIDLYRDALKEELKIKKIDKKVVLVNVDTAIGNQYNYMYADALHLNSIGYEKYNEVIINKISYLIKKQK